MNRKKKEPLVRLAKRGGMAAWKVWCIRLGSILLALVLGGLVISAVGVNPLSAYGTILSGSLGKKTAIRQTVKIAVQLHIDEGVTEERAAGGRQVLRLHLAVVPGQVLAGDPFAHEPDVVRADVLVRDQDVQRLRAAHDLLQQQVGLGHAEARGEGPVGSDALALHPAAAVDDARVLEAARGHEPPQPGQGRRNDVQQAHNAVIRLVRRGRRHAHTEAPDIDGHRLPGHDVLDHIPRDNDARVRAGLAVGILHVLPDEAGRAGHAVHVEEQQGP